MKIFNNDDRIKFSIHPICNWDNIYREYVCSNDEIKKRELELIRIFHKDNLKLEDLVTKKSACYACLKNNYIIDANFHVKKCTVHLDDINNDLGVFDNFDSINDANWIGFKFKECPDCIMFPKCLGKVCKFKKYKNYKECQEHEIQGLEVMLNEQKN